MACLPVDDFIIRTMPVENPEPFAVVLARFRRHSGLRPADADVFEQTVLAMHQALRRQEGRHDRYRQAGGTHSDTCAV